MKTINRKRMVFFSKKLTILIMSIIIVFTCVMLSLTKFHTPQTHTSFSVSLKNPIKQVYMANPAKGQFSIKKAFLSKCARIYDGKIDLVRMKKGICTLIYSFVNNPTTIYNLAQAKQYIFIG